MNERGNWIERVFWGARAVAESMLSVIIDKAAFLDTADEVAGCRSISLANSRVKQLKQSTIFAAATIRSLFVLAIKLETYLEATKLLSDMFESRGSRLSRLCSPTHRRILIKAYHCAKMWRIYDVQYLHDKRAVLRHRPTCLRRITFCTFKAFNNWCAWNQFSPTPERTSQISELARRSHDEPKHTARASHVAQCKWFSDTESGREERPRKAKKKKSRERLVWIDKAEFVCA